LPGAASPSRPPILRVKMAARRPATIGPLPTLYLLVFTGGMTSLALELSASRLLGAYFGASNMVWASVIGLILIYLAAGYYLGGRWADRAPGARLLYQFVAWAALATASIPVLAHLFLPFLASLDLPLPLAVGLALLGLFTVPVTLLGCVSPFAVRLTLVTVGNAGKIAGRIYALSTLGSALGALLPVLILLPQAGITATFNLFALALMASALLGLAVIDRRAALRLGWMPVLSLLAWGLL
jgi:predicted membrane-bound spermidine synthase